MMPPRFIYTKNYRRVLGRRTQEDRARDFRALASVGLSVVVQTSLILWGESDALFKGMFFIMLVITLFIGANYLRIIGKAYILRDAAEQFMTPDVQRVADDLLESVPIQMIEVTHFREIHDPYDFAYELWLDIEGESHTIKVSPREVDETEGRSLFFYRELRFAKAKQLPDGDILELPPSVYPVSLRVNPRDAVSFDGLFDK